MTRDKALDLFQQAQAYDDPDAFVAAARRELFYSPTYPPEPLRRIWVTARAPFRDFLRELGQTQSGFARRHGIPLRTTQSGAIGERTCPAYLRLLLAESEGYIKIEEDGSSR